MSVALYLQQLMSLNTCELAAYWQYEVEGKQCLLAPLICFSQMLSVCESSVMCQDSAILTLVSSDLPLISHSYTAEVHPNPSHP